MTDAQERVYAFLLEHADRPRSPTYQEIAAGIGWKSKSTVKRVLDRLEQDGFIRRTAGRDQSIRVLRANPLRDFPTEELVAELRIRGVTAL